MAAMAPAGGPMNTSPAAAQALAKSLVLAQETVAGVHRLRAGGQRCVDDALPLQVAVARRVAAHVHGLVAGTHVEGVGVGVGVHRHGAHAQAARGGGHAAGDLTAVGNQDLLEHLFSSSISAQKPC
jgi:hypothetical protein